MIAEWVFWGCMCVIAYTYAGYPLLVAALARMSGQRPSTGPNLPAITVVVAAYNEATAIAARVRDILDQDYPYGRLKVLVVSDGSVDGTETSADIGDPRVEVLALEHNMGKAGALNSALSRVRTPLVAFTDARQRFAPGAIRELVPAFADPAVGVVSGELMIEGAAGGAADVGLYWRMERRLRADEAALGWLHGVSGAIYAMRRDLFKPMPPGTILDDMWIPLQAVLAGRRVWVARKAIAIDRSSANASEEFRRKLRTLAGNWQLLARMPVLANPFRNPVFSAMVSHKFLRLLVPWALLAALAASAVAAGAVYRVFFFMQVAAYAAACLAVWRPAFASRVPLFPVAGTFLLLNLAALLSLPAALAWDPSRLWKQH